MVEINKGLEKSGEQPAATTVGPPLELHPQTPAAKQQARKDLATSDDQMVKANVLPPLPDFPKPESLDGGTQTKTFDANQRVTSDISTLANSSSGSIDLKQTTQYDPSGKATSRDTSWTDAKGKQHDVVEGNGVVTNTIVDGVNTSKLVTRADGSWEHDENAPGSATVTKVEKDHTVSLTQRNLETGESLEHVSHPNGFTEDTFTRKGFRESQTKDSAGVLRFDAIVDAKTVDGRTDYHSNKRFDHKGNVLSNDSHWIDNKGVYHENDTLNFADRTQIHSVTTGDTTKTTTTKPDGTSKTATIKADGTTIDENGLTHKPDALDKPGQ
jgi:hypothetical protein